MKNFTALLLLIIILPGCAVNPVTGKNELSWISETEQINIGEAQYGPSQQSQGGVYLADPEINAYVNQVGQKLAVFSQVKLPYEFIVINNDVPNAWALPGGKIAVNRGLLLQLKNEAELAAVLSHEIVHAAAKHGAQAMQRGTITQGLLTATSLALSQSEYAEYSDYVVGSAQLGLQLINTRYGRGAELEADFYGIEYMQAAGYDARAAVSLQETFVALSKNKQSNWLEGLFASHPPSQERVNLNRKNTSQLSAGGELKQAHYENRIAHLRNTASAYKHLKEAQALAGKNNPSKALMSISKAIKVEPKEAQFYGGQGSIYYQQEQFKKAKQAFDKALSLDDNFFEYYLGRGLSYARLGKTKAAQEDLERSISLLPTATANHNLGEIALAGGERSTAKSFFRQAMGAQGTIGNLAKLAFLKLDIKDNPKRYISASLQAAANGQLMILVSNKANVDIESLKLEVIATIGQQEVKRSILIENLKAASGLKYPSAWYANESTEVHSVNFSISALSLK